MYPTSNAPVASVLIETVPIREGLRMGRLKLNRPGQLNALNLDMCEVMLAQLQAWQSDESIVAVLLEGSGDKGFCAGGDVAGVVRHIREGGSQRFVYGDRFFSVEYQLDALIHEYRKPLITWAHGVHMGGGVGLTAGARHRIVTDGSRIAMPEIHIGLFPDVGGGWFLNRVPGGLGRVMALTGLTINEADALFAGLADCFIPREERAAFDEALLRLDWRGDADHDNACVRRLLLSASRRYHAGLPESGLRQYFDALRFIASQPDVSSMLAALQAAAAEDDWFAAPAQSLARGSAVAARVTDLYLQRCVRRSLREVLALDLVLAMQFQRHPDFIEGVRALLIDKDRKPRWSYADFESVPRAMIEAHFSI